ncbi:MAG: signal peptidase I [Chloroflexi bacterium]|nr:signal peptidase I [Chloroflexota bacterium]MDL1942431.1 signal peptidase I [Chloroflexi bacterium CFX2]
MMTPGKSSSRLFFSLSALALVLVFWLTLAPVQLGGWVTYVIVDGSSMEPGFTFGDLVLVRSASAYGVGDAVVYRDANMDSFVFHRIVGTELDRFVLQGDNNDWLDSYRPTRDEIIGKLWLSIPRLGRAFEWLRTPLNLSLTVGLLGGILMLDLFKKPSRNKKQNLSYPNIGGMNQAALFGSALFAMFFLVLGIYSFTRPLHKPAENIPYQQEGFYYYSATGTPGVYDTDVVRSGEPVFPKLTCFLNIGFTYNLLGERLQGVSGTYKMYARILDEQSGWQRTLPLNADTAFTGSSYFTMAALDLCQVESIVNLVEAEAGLKQVAYTLEIVTDTSFTAGAEGNIIQDSFSPALTFKYDKVHFYLDAADPQVDPLRSSKPGLISSSVSEMNTVSFLGLNFPVWLVRFVSLTGFVLSSAALLAVGVKFYRLASQSEEALIRLKYGALLVDVYEQNLAPSTSMVDVASLDDLARLAERHGTMILHMQRNFLHFYFVQSHGTTYRYVVSAGKKGTVEAGSEQEKIAASFETVEKPASSPEPKPKRGEPPAEKPLVIQNRLIYTYPPQEEFMEIESRPVEAKKPVRAAPDPVEEVEYVIDTGAIEFTAPWQDAVFLQKIKI